MNVREFFFELPPELIAQEPPEARGASRLLHLNRATGARTHSTIDRLAALLDPGDLLVANDTRVFPARLLGHRVPSGGAVECLLLNQEPTEHHEPPDPGSRIPDPGPQTWNALVHPGQKLKPGARVVFERDGIRIDGEVIAMRFQGRRTLRLSTEHTGGLADAIDRIGHIPLPPYIKRNDVEG